LSGSAKINGTGNGLNNILVGNDTNNTLSGLVGDDTLTGGLGSDKLIFRAKPIKLTCRVLAELLLLARNNLVQLMQREKLVGTKQHILFMSVPMPIISLNFQFY
jgi:hypothetical protein